MGLNATNHDRTLNKKTAALSYHFVRDHVDNSDVEVSNIKTRKFCSSIHKTPGEK